MCGTCLGCVHKHMMGMYMCVCVCVFECVCVCMCTGVCICLGECGHAFVKCVLWGLCMCVFAFWSYIGSAALDEEIVSSHHCFLDTTESKQGRKG